MNQVLGRRSIDSAKGGIVSGLRDEILALLSVSTKFIGPEFTGEATALREVLARREIVLQQVAAFSRVFVEKILMKIQLEHQIERRPDLASNIQTLGYKTNQIVAPWVVNHMHALRVFGNESLHGGGAVSYRPESLKDDDLVALLTSLRSVIQFWTGWNK